MILSHSTKFFVDTTKTFVVIIVFVKRMPQKPTASELTVLHVLWGRGPSTVREVHEALSEEKQVGYTSVLKFLQIMTAKGLVRRNESQRAHVYEACLPAEQTKRQLAGDILQRVFEGSASQLMMHALAGRKGSREEIEELRRLLDEYERRRR
jgi:BlaI family transcriptional regulator, penicillinase repressor